MHAKWAIICELWSSGCWVTAIYISTWRRRGAGNQYAANTAIFTEFWHLFFTLTVRIFLSAYNEPIFCVRIAYGRCVMTIYVRTWCRSGAGNQYVANTAVLTQFRRFLFALTVRVFKFAKMSYLFRTRGVWSLFYGNLCKYMMLERCRQPIRRQYCNINSISALLQWEYSNPRKMSYLFYSCGKLSLFYGDLRKYMRKDPTLPGFDRCHRNYSGVIN